MNTTYDLVRHHAALFDFSDKGRFFVTGNAAIDAVNSVIAADLETIPELKALNTVLLNDDGSLIAIVWVLKVEDGIWVLCDAECRDAVATQLKLGIAGLDASYEDRTATTVCWSLIGPLAQEIAIIAAGDDIIGISYLGLEPNAVTNSLICRLGSTGEFEYLFIANIEHKATLQQQLLDAGTAQGLELGDSTVLPLLMLEMRYLSQHHHIPPGINPIQAGLHWMIHFRKPAFPGRNSVIAHKAAPGSKAMLLLMHTTEPPPAGTAIKLGGQEFGHCVYAVYSPTLEATIGLGYVETKFAWVGIVFDVAGMDARAVSAPLFITQTVATRN